MLVLLRAHPTGAALSAPVTPGSHRHAAPSAHLLLRELLAPPGHADLGKTASHFFNSILPSNALPLLLFPPHYHSLPLERRVQRALLAPRLIPRCRLGTRRRRKEKGAGNPAQLASSLSAPSTLSPECFVPSHLHHLRTSPSFFLLSLAPGDGR